MLKFNVLKDKISFKYIMVPRYSGIDKNRSCKKLFNIVLWNLFVIFKLFNLYIDELKQIKWVWSNIIIYRLLIYFLFSFTFSFPCIFPQILLRTKHSLNDHLKSIPNYPNNFSFFALFLVALFAPLYLNQPICTQ